MPDELRKRWLHSKGYCTNCKKQDAYTMAGRWLCFDCTVKKQKYLKQYRNVNKDAINQAQNDKRTERVKSGLCRVCGAPAYNGTTFCYKHLWKHRLYRKKCNANKRKYKNPDTCRWCDKPVVPGKCFCVECLKRKAEIALYASHQRDLTNHPWNKDTHLIAVTKENTVNANSRT